MHPLDPRCITLLQDVKRNTSVDTGGRAGLRSTEARSFLFGRRVLHRLTINKIGSGTGTIPSNPPGINLRNRLFEPDCAVSRLCPLDRLACGRLSIFQLEEPQSV